MTAETTKTEATPQAAPAGVLLAVGLTCPSTSNRKHIVVGRACTRCAHCKPTAQAGYVRCLHPGAWQFKAEIDCRHALGWLKPPTVTPITPETLGANGKPVAPQFTKELTDPAQIEKFYQDFKPRAEAAGGHVDCPAPPERDDDPERQSEDTTDYDEADGDAEEDETAGVVDYPGEDAEAACAEIRAQDPLAAE
jgi:hypothetical protein